LLAIRLSWTILAVSIPARRFQGTAKKGRAGKA
jgi:hypothetical protein